MTEEITQTVSLGEVKDDLRHDTVQIDLETGGKRLALIINGPTNTIQTGIYSYIFEPQQPGATTRLYERAHQLMIESAVYLDRPLYYSLITRHPKMKKWALDQNKGRRIFTWDEVLNIKTLLMANKLVLPTA